MAPDCVNKYIVSDSLLSNNSYKFPNKCVVLNKTRILKSQKYQYHKKNKIIATLAISEFK